MTSTESPVNYYKLLGIEYNATTRDVTRAYRAAMKDTHPDKVAPVHRPQAEERAKLLNLALRTLTRPEDRSRYDQTLRKDLVQDQIMSQYFGGMGMPGGKHDRFAEALRREQTAYEKSERKQSDRSATVSVLLIFGGATALVVCLLVFWAVVSALVRVLL